MKLVNILYDNDYAHAQLILVPDDVANNINKVVQCFFDWVEDDNNIHEYWTYVNGRKVLCTGAKSFVHWLNNVYVKSNSDESKVINEETEYNPELPTAEF